MENCEQINAVQRMRDYIEGHITESITLYMLAKTANYSPWHSARIFKELIGKTPFEYIRAIRMSLAAVKLREDDVRIIDVAFDFVFDSHEGFIRAFSKQFGMTPQYYSRNLPPLKLFMPNRIQDYYLNKLGGENKMLSNESDVNAVNNADTVFIQVIDRPARKLILKRGINASEYFQFCDEVGCDVWGVLSSIKDALYEPVGMWMPYNLRKPGTSEYTQGVEVPIAYTGEVPEGYEIIDLPTCKMMFFQGQPYDDERFGEAIGNLSKAIKNYNPEMYGFAWADEDAPKCQLAPMGYRDYIEARPVQPIYVK